MELNSAQLNGGVDPEGVTLKFDQTIAPSPRKPSDKQSKSDERKSKERKKLENEPIDPEKDIELIDIEKGPEKNEEQ